MAAISKGFLFHFLSLLAEAALTAEQGFSSGGLTSRAVCSWSLIPWLTTLEQQDRREEEYIQQLLQWGWQSSLGVWDVDPLLSSICCRMSAADISQNLSLDLSLFHNGDNQVLGGI